MTTHLTHPQAASLARELAALPVEVETSQVSALLQQALNRPPESFDFYCVAKECYQLGAHEVACACLLLYVKEDGAQAAGRHMLGYALWRCNKHKEAVPELIHAIQGTRVCVWW